MQSKNALKALCLTSKALNAEFSTFLYRELHIFHQWPKHALMNKNLRHVKKATVEMPYGCDSSEYNKFVQQALIRMVNLRTLEWQFTPMTQKTLDVVTVCCPKLEGLGFTHFHRRPEGVARPNGPIEAEGEREFKIPMSIGFMFPINLRYFSHRLMQGNISNQRSAIVTLLRRCPRLEHLGLSIFRCLEASDTQPSWWPFLDNLCDEYQQKGGLPLRLKSLDLGSLVYPTREDSLDKLTDLFYLRSLRIDNSHRRYRFNTTPMALDAFKPANCPQLTRFVFGSDSFETRRLLGRFLSLPDAAGTQHSDTSPLNMCIACPFASFAELIKIWMRLPVNTLNEAQVAGLSLPFRVLHISLALSNKFPHRKQSVYPWHQYGWDMCGAIESLRLLSQTTKDTLEELSIILPFYIQYPAGPKNVKVPTSILNALEQTLATLTKLSALAITMVEYPYGQGISGFALPRKELNFQGVDAARYYAGVVPSLKYIMVNGTSWKVSRLGDKQFALHEMSMYEIDRVELFHQLEPLDMARPRKCHIFAKDKGNKSRIGRNSLPYLTLPLTDGKIRSWF